MKLDMYEIGESALAFSIIFLCAYLFWIVTP